MGGDDGKEAEAVSVIAFPGGYNERDPRGMAIEFAAHLAGGHYGRVGYACIVFETEEGLGLLTAGEDAQCGYRLIGLLEAAKMSVFSDGADEC